MNTDGTFGSKPFRLIPALIFMSVAARTTEAIAGSGEAAVTYRWIAGLIVFLLACFAWSWLMRRQVERRSEALRRSEEQYRLLADNTLDAIWTMNLDLTFTYINPACQDLTGFTPEEWIGSRLSDHCDEANFALMARVIADEMAKGPEGSGVIFEATMIKKNGDPIPLEIRGKIIYDTEGRPVRLQGITRDISERRRAEQRIEHLNRVLRSIRDVTQLVSKERNPENLIREGCRLLVENRGYSVALIILTDGNDRPVFWASSGMGTPSDRRDAVFAEGNLPTCCDFARSSEGVVLMTDKRDACERCPISEISVEKCSLCVRLVHEGVAFGYLIASLSHDLSVDEEERGLFSEMAGDIAYALNFIRLDESRRESENKRKSLEAQLIQAQKMEAIGTLAGGIAHDFNNILSSIIGFTELALEDVAKGSVLEENLQEVFGAGIRAKELVKQILAFARQADEEIKPIQVDAIAGEVLKFIRSSIPSTIEIKQNLTSDSLIMGNSTQIHQIFMNICTNAAQAMEQKGGILSVGLKDILLDSESGQTEKLDLSPGEYLEISISDTGSGIAPETIGSIFEPYFTTKGVGEGTGMGLAVVHGIIESYHGKIRVDSEIGRGSTFTIYLPITKRRNVQRSDEISDLPGGAENILLLDDEVQIARMSSRILERLGYSVTSRTSSIEALELFRSKPNAFDLVITDMTMPNMTGELFAVEVMKIRPDIPVILCTGYSNKISDERAALIGIKAFAYKPIVKANLARTVRNVLDRAAAEAHRRRSF